VVDVGKPGTWVSNTGLYLFAFEGNGGNSKTNLEMIEQDHEQNGFAPRQHTTCLELDYILSPFASLCLVDAFLKIITQILAVTQVSMVLEFGVIT